MVGGAGTTTALFELQNWAGKVAANELTHLSPASVGVMYGTGLLMSLSPCALSMLPLTMGYVVGTEDESGSLAPSVSFAFGIALVLSLLGYAATLAGSVVGNLRFAGPAGEIALPLAASAFAITMGLSLLDLVEFRLPSLGGDGLGKVAQLPRSLRAFALGATSALIATPCCTPVLASILGFVGSTRDPILGVCLLLVYSLGYTTPVIAAGMASGSLSSLMNASGATWITPLSAGALIFYGTYQGLGVLFSAGI
jgi:cytochrome c-type biogenesis protein